MTGAAMPFGEGKGNPGVCPDAEPDLGVGAGGDGIRFRKT